MDSSVSKKTFRDHSDSIYEACSYKLSFIEQSQDETLTKLSKGIRKFLFQEKENITDKSDFITFRRVSSTILQLLALIIPSTKTSANWISPLLEESYSLLSIDKEDRLILISQFPERLQADTSDGFAIISDILKSFKGILPDKLTDDIIDIFIIPSEAQFDFVSLAVLGHELGHVLWKIHFNDTIESIIENKFNEFLGDDKKNLDIFELKEKENMFISHVQEYFCDEVGRKLFGLVFDIALLKIIGITATTKSSSSHPPEKSRVKISRNNISEFIEYNTSTNFDDTFVKILEDFNSIYTDKDEEIEDQEFLVRTVEEINIEVEKEGVKLFKNDVDINKIWNKVSPELNAFRPPVEVSESDNIKQITPIEAIIGVVLYYYNNENLAKNNEYFLSSDDSDDKKHTKLKQILKSHLIYSVGLGSFIDEVRKKTQFQTEELKNTLWSMRTRSTGGQKNPLSIVPSIQPSTQYGQNSVDLRLGSYFLVHKPSKYTHISPSEKDKQQLSNLYDEIYISPKDDFILHPHQFILATTLEYISLPFDFYALILGRSSWGRLGLNIATATTVQSGFRGCITLELRNLGETPIPLTVGVRIAQLCLIKVPIESTTKSYFSVSGNKYIGPVKAEFPKLYKDKDWDLLR